MRKLLPTLSSLLIAGPALAHPGEHHGNLYATLWHLLTEPDHLALSAIAMIVGAGAVLLTRRPAANRDRSTRDDSR